MSGEWTDQIAGARMKVDQQFTDRVLDSQFSNQQWGLIMTAVEFEIKNPENPAEAELKANTEKISQIIPELDSIPQGRGGAPGSPDASGPGGGLGSGSGVGGDILGRIKGLFSRGVGSNDHDEQQERAETLVEEYAVALQAHLEETGRWEEICTLATE